MFRIRKVADNVTPADRDAVTQAQEIIRGRPSSFSPSEIEELPEILMNPLKYRFRPVLFVADDMRGKVKGFALMLHEREERFSFLDSLSAGLKATGEGIGGALYEKVREEALRLGSKGLFFECLPDEPEVCDEPGLLKQNAARMRFYERYGVRPIVNTKYETPIAGQGGCAPYLMYDDLGSGAPLRRGRARRIARAILERRYGGRASAEYIEMVVDSFRDDPVQIRPPRYTTAATSQPVEPADHRLGAVALVVSEGHEIHHVRQRGYVEAPARIGAVLKVIEKAGFFRRMRASHFSDRWVTYVHDRRFVEYLKRVSATLEPGQSVYPYVFPVRNAARPPKELDVRGGYYLIDTFTPLNRNAYAAARRAVDCALTAARTILEGGLAAYALVRPPGHHAERGVCGGFCYLNSTAIAANYLSRHGKVAVLDLDHHHGNGTQDIFYGRADVLTVSIHGHPRYVYPFFSGFRDERGEGMGEGCNVNYPLEGKVDGKRYLGILRKALKRVEEFGPQFLVVALGLDPARGDPTGDWLLGAKDFERNGREVASLGLRSLVVQEGGYKTRSLGTNVLRFFTGLLSAGV